MTKHYFASLIFVISSISWATPPGEDLIRSCLKAQSAPPSISFREISSADIFQEDHYADGFDASYIIKQDGFDIGYAERESEPALIYHGKIYRLSKSTPVGDSGGVKFAAFNPMLAQWSFVKDVRQKYFCVSFNFDGLGRSGSYQNVRGGYLLSEKTDRLYFAVRSVR